VGFRFGLAGFQGGVLIFVSEDDAARGKQAGLAIHSAI
jgi:hypothetical protein